jgi:hypothetical protein
MYQTRWVKCVQEATGSTVDYIGIWNEKSAGPVGCDASPLFANSDVVVNRVSDRVSYHM